MCSGWQPMEWSSACKQILCLEMAFGCHAVQQWQHFLPLCSFLAFPKMGRARSKVGSSQECPGTHVLLWPLQSHVSVLASAVLHPSSCLLFAGVLFTPSTTWVTSNRGQPFFFFFCFQGLVERHGIELRPEGELAPL